MFASWEGVTCLGGGGRLRGGEVGGGVKWSWGAVCQSLSYSGVLEDQVASFQRRYDDAETSCCLQEVKWGEDQEGRNPSHPPTPNHPHPQPLPRTPLQSPLYFIQCRSELVPLAATVLRVILRVAPL